MDTAAELRERLKLKYMGDCKCGHCALVPDELVARASDEIELLRTALEQIVYTEDINPTAYKIARAAIAAVDNKP